MGQHGRLHRHRHVATRILQQRDEVVGGMADQRVLEIEQAKAMRGRIVDQHDIFGMIVAQHRHRRAGGLLDQRQHLIPCADIGVDIDRKIDGRAIIFGQQTDFALIDAAIIGRQVSGRQPMQFRQQIDSAGIDRQFLARMHVQMLLDPQVAEILDQDQALGQVARQDTRRGKAILPQSFGDGDEGARILLRRWRVHQHGLPFPADDAEVAAKGGIACQRQDRGFSPPGLGEESGGGGGRDQIWDHRSVQASGTSAVKRRAPSSNISMVRRRLCGHSASPSRSGHSIRSSPSIR